MLPPLVEDVLQKEDNATLHSHCKDPAFCAGLLKYCHYYGRTEWIYHYRNQMEFHYSDISALLLQAVQERVASPFYLHLLLDILISRFSPEEYFYLIPRLTSHKEKDPYEAELFRLYQHLSNPPP